ncbi:MAG: hypothetical protein APF84_19285 [Gracilibacter sp. BRH_c7a]|nr:MAG: hypothetical protein APF84_19285 [Gracilibacter sp. BRH_c7a]
MALYKKILVLLLTVCLFFNSTAVLAASSYTDDNIGIKIISVEKEKERLQKKFSSMKDWIGEMKPYKSFIAKNQTFLKFRENLSKFFHGARAKLNEQLDRNFTTL